MSLRAWLASMCLLLPSAACAGEAAPPAPRTTADRDRLQGYWLMHSSTVEGDVETFEMRDQCFAQITKNEFVYNYHNMLTGRFMAVDPYSEPRKIDLTPPGGGGRERGIYRLEDDRLSICLAEEGDRPVGFSAPKGAGVRLFEFRRLSLKEEQAVAGTLPAESWAAEESAVGRCKVSFPLRPKKEESPQFAADMVLFMPSRYYHFTCVRLTEEGGADSQRLKKKLDQIALQGEVTQSRESTTPEGYARLAFRLQPPDQGKRLEGRLTIAHGMLYEQFVVGPQAFVESPNSACFFDSLAIRAPAVGELLSNFTSFDYDVQTAAVKMLKGRGVTVIPELSRALAHNDDRIRMGAARTLKEFGAAAKEAVPSLEKALHDESSFVRSDAMRALEAVGAPSIAALVRALPDPRGDFFSLTSTLDRIDPAWRSSESTKQAMPTVIASLSARDDGQRRWAAAAVADIGPLAKEAVPRLGAMLSEPDHDARRGAAHALRKVGPAASGAKAELLRALADRLPEVRKNAAEALGNIGPGVLPDLVQAMSSPYGEVRVAAAESMGHLGAGGAAAVPHLIRALRDPDGYVKLAAIASLGKLGPTAAAAVPALEAIQNTVGDEEARAALQRIRK